MKEETAKFGQESAKIGVITTPDDDSDHLPAIIFLNAGLIHHIGPSRIYVKLARQFAALGFLCLRFDLSGVGDSDIRQDSLSFMESTNSDVQEAMNFLNRSRHIREFIIIGHCSGAIQSFMCASRDERVVGAIILNPEGADQGWGDYDRKRKEARYYQNYYAKDALKDRSRWVKLLTGKAAYRSIIRNLFKNIIWNRLSAFMFRFQKSKAVQPGDAAPQPVVAETLDALRSLSKQDKQLLFVYSAGSTGLERFQLLLKNELLGLETAPIFSLKTITGADHLFTLHSTQDYLAQVLKNWIEEKFVQAYVSDAI